MPQIYTPPKELTCCFTGHRAIPYEEIAGLKRKLELEISWLYTHGITEFVAGGALGFDTLAEQAVLRARAINPEIRLHLYIPSPYQAYRWNEHDVAMYNKIRELADTVSIIGTNNSASSMHARNRAMVDASSYCIAYFDPETVDPLHPTRGGTLNTIKYASMRGLGVTNLHDEFPAPLDVMRDFT